MKLFLTSSGLSDSNESSFLKLLGKDPKGLKVAFIPTAMNPEPEEARNRYIPGDVADLEKLGMQVSFVDIEKIQESDTVEVFAPYDVIYVYGGNTFYLMHYANRSGFKKHIQEIIKDKIYFGVSAGSIIAGADISPAGWGNADPNDIGLRDLSGLSLVPYVIKPHWKGNISEEGETYLFEVKYIKDGDAIVVE